MTEEQFYLHQILAADKVPSFITKRDRETKEYKLCQKFADDGIMQRCTVKKTGEELFYLTLRGEEIARNL